MLRIEAHSLRTDATLNDLVESNERTTANEEDIRSIELDVFLVGVLAATLRWNISNGALQNLQERLLNALTRHVACNRYVIGLAANFINFIDVNDTTLSLLDVVIR